jgi:hypothetical protein
MPSSNITGSFAAIGMSLSLFRRSNLRVVLREPKSSVHFRPWSAFPDLVGASRVTLIPPRPPHWCTAAHCVCLSLRYQTPGHRTVQGSRCFSAVSKSAALLLEAAFDTAHNLGDGPGDLCMYIPAQCRARTLNPGTKDTGQNSPI